MRAENWEEKEDRGDKGEVNRREGGCRKWQKQDGGTEQRKGEKIEGGTRERWSTRRRESCTWPLTGWNGLRVIRAYLMAWEGEEMSSTILTDMGMRWNATEISQSLLQKVNHMSIFLYQSQTRVSCSYIDYKPQSPMCNKAWLQSMCSAWADTDTIILPPEWYGASVTNADTYHRYLKDHFTYFSLTSFRATCCL